MSDPNSDVMSEKDRMLAGRYYYAVRDPQLLRERQESQALCAQYNATKGTARAGSACQGHIEALSLSIHTLWAVLESLESFASVWSAQMVLPAATGYVV